MAIFSMTNKFIKVVGLGRVHINVLVSEPVGDIENDKEGWGEPHGPGVNVVADGFGVSINWWINCQ